MSTSTIAGLHAAGHIEGDTQITGTITTVEQHTNAARNNWATVAITDHDATINLLVYPRMWLQAHHLLAVGAHVTATGRLYQVGGTLSVICTSLTEERREGSRDR